MEYGKMINGQLIIHRAKQEGDKPIVRTATPTFEYNESPYFYWEETETEIVQHWGVSIVPDMLPDGLHVSSIEANRQYGRFLESYLF